MKEKGSNECSSLEPPNTLKYLWLQYLLELYTSRRRERGMGRKGKRREDNKVAGGISRTALSRSFFSQPVVYLSLALKYVGLL